MPPAVQQIETNYNPPPLGAEERAAQRAEAASRLAVDGRITADIRRCGDLLREMYGLDLAIWRGDADPEEQLRLRHKTDAIFGEVRRVAAGWQAQVQSGAWPDDEAATLAEICQAILREPASRYQDGGGGVVAEGAGQGPAAPRGVNPPTSGRQGTPPQDVAQQRKPPSRTRPGSSQHSLPSQQDLQWRARFPPPLHLISPLFRYQARWTS